MVQVTKIVFKNLVIDLSEKPAVRAELSKLNTDGDDDFGVDDIVIMPEHPYGKEKAERERADIFFNRLTAVFVKTNQMSEEQALGVRDFFTAYNKTLNVKRTIETWGNHVSNYQVRDELDFGKKYWDSNVKPQFVEGGMFFSRSVDENFYYALKALTGNADDDKEYSGVEKLEYDLGKVPHILRSSVEYITERHNVLEDYLENGCSYFSCEGEGCKTNKRNAEFYMINIIDIEKGPKWKAGKKGTD